jgi:integrase
MARPFLRGGSYYIRVNVPRPQRAELGRNEIVRSLHTGNWAEATRRAPGVVAEVQASLERERADRATASTQTAIRLRLAELGIPVGQGNSELDGQWTDARLETLARAFELGTCPTPATRVETLRPGIQVLVAATRSVIEPTDLDGILRGVGDLYFVPSGDTKDDQGRPFPDFGPCPTYGERYIAQEVRKLRPGNAPGGQKSRLADLVDSYLASSKMREKTKTAIRRASMLFIGLVGEKTPAAYTRADTRMFRDQLALYPRRLDKRLQALPIRDRLNRGEPVAAKTVKRDLDYLRSAFAWAKKEDLLPSNPFEGLTTPTALGRRRVSYTRAELIQLFGYLSATPRDDEKRLTIYWLLVLAAATGARLDEIAQLRTEHVHRDGGITYLQLSRVNMVLKNASSERRIPIHAHIAEEFMVFVQGRGTGLLFPRLTPDHDGKRTNLASKWCISAIRSAGLHKDVHTLRHTFKDLCRDAGIDIGVSHELTGHADGTVGSRYGQGSSIATLSKNLNRIQLDFIPAATPKPETDFTEPVAA